MIERTIYKQEKVLFIAFLIVGMLFSANIANAQTPSPTPSNSDDTVTWGGYEVKAGVEVGYRWVEVKGNENKFRSDFNYKRGVRLFDSSFLLENKTGDDKVFDSMRVTTTGWGADPYGSVRLNMDKTGIYKLDANVRQVRHVNALNNFAFGWKGAKTTKNFGDVDLTVNPESEKIRYRLGLSYYKTTGSGGFTTRVFSDEFPILKNVDVKSVDLRAGADGKLAGFNLGFTVGMRRFNDNTYYYANQTQLGQAQTDPATLSFVNRAYPIKGKTTYGLFNVNRNIFNKLDFTGRLIYSYTDRKFVQSDLFGGTGTVRGQNPPVVYNYLSDLVSTTGGSNRPQWRGDVGLTYAFTERFRISNTFSYDDFEINGSANQYESAIRVVLATGASAPNVYSATNFSRISGYKRFTNTIEADYQHNKHFGINVGYRYTHRKVREFRLDQNAVTNAVTIVQAEEANSANSLLIGTRIKPYDNWSIFADAEIGDSDNAFTRLSNYKFRNYRVRSNWNYKTLAFNLSGIIRDNENPSSSTAVGPVAAGDYISDVKSRVFSAYIDWSPNEKFSISPGYTFHSLTSRTDIIIPLAAFTRGTSEYYMRDNFAFIDISARPTDRLSLYASYRFNKDGGQGERFPAAPQTIISSYPFQLHMPEVKAVFKLTNNIDWNVGYQYYGYRENTVTALIPYYAPYTTPLPGTPLPPRPNQNYTTHMPYTSLKIYFGGGDR